MFGKILGFLGGRIPWWVYALAAAAAVTIVTGLYLEHQRAIKKAAFSAGVAEDKARSDKVIDKLERDAFANARAAEEKVEATESKWREIAVGAQHDLDEVIAKNRRIGAALAAAATERDRLRDDRARTAIVTGGVTASDDSVAACRDRTERTWSALEAALRTSRECAGDAEDASEGVRSLRAAWPMIP